MRLASKFGLPIITLVDTPGAYPGIGAEERGQAEAIAYNLKEIPKLRVPIIPVIHGEGGSGGALAIAVGDHVLMLENAVYSVIAPESCSSILWRDWEHKQDAARILKLTADDFYGFRIIDEIVPEPPEGAHADPQAAATALRAALERSLTELLALSLEELQRRRNKGCARWPPLSLKPDPLPAVSLRALEHPFSLWSASLFRPTTKQLPSPPSWTV